RGDILLGEQVETADRDRVGQSLGGHGAAHLLGGRAVEGEREVQRDELFQGAGELALLGLDQLQIGEALAAGRFLVLQGLDRERHLELGHVADVVQPLRVAGGVAGADVDAPLSGEIGHGQSPLRVLGEASGVASVARATPCSISQRAVASSRSSRSPGAYKRPAWVDRKSTRLNSSHVKSSYAVF